MPSLRMVVAAAACALLCGLTAASAAVSVQQYSYTTANCTDAGTAVQTYTVDACIANSGNDRLGNRGLSYKVQLNSDKTKLYFNAYMQDNCTGTLYQSTEQNTGCYLTGTSGSVSNLGYVVVNANETSSSFTFPSAGADYAIGASCTSTVVSSATLTSCEASSTQRCSPVATSFGCFKGATSDANIPSGYSFKTTCGQGGSVQLRYKSVDCSGEPFYAGVSNIGCQLGVSKTCPSGAPSVPSALPSGGVVQFLSSTNCNVSAPVSVSLYTSTCNPDNNGASVSTSCVNGTYSLQRYASADCTGLANSRYNWNETNVCAFNQLGFCNVVTGAQAAGVVVPTATAGGSSASTGSSTGSSLTGAASAVSGWVLSCVMAVVVAVSMLA